MTSSSAFLMSRMSRGVNCGTAAPIHAGEKRGKFSVQLTRWPVFHHHGIQVVAMQALKSAPVITGFFVRFDPCKPHRRATLRASPTADLRGNQFLIATYAPPYQRQASSPF